MIRAWISRTAEQAQAELETLDESEFAGQDVVLKLHEWSPLPENLAFRLVGLSLH